MSYFNILQVSTENQIKEHESGYQIIIDTNRFLEYTNEDIRIFYKQINQEKLDLLKKYPTFITYERFEKEISLAQIKNIIYQATEQNIIINYNRLLAKIKKRSTFCLFFIQIKKSCSTIMST